MILSAIFCNHQFQKVEVEEDVKQNHTRGTSKKKRPSAPAAAAVMVVAV
jgi:hypothetical protein